MAASVNGHPEHLHSLHRDRGASRRTPEAVHSDQSRSLARRAFCLDTPQGPGHTNLYPGNIVLLSFAITTIHVIQH